MKLLVPEATQEYLEALNDLLHQQNSVLELPYIQDSPLYHRSRGSVETYQLIRACQKELVRDGRPMTGSVILDSWEDSYTQWHKDRIWRANLDMANQVTRTIEWIEAWGPTHLGSDNTKDSMQFYMKSETEGWEINQIYKSNNEAIFEARAWAYAYDPIDPSKYMMEMTWKVDVSV